VDIGITRITVTGPMRGDGTLTVVAHGRVVELDVQAGDTAREVAQRIALALA
jgi:phage tail sheath gpL-like